MRGRTSAATFQTPHYFVSVRPHLTTFLNSALEWFDVAVWTSAGEGYGRAVISKIFPNPDTLQFSWFSNRCTRKYDLELQRHYFVKDLKKVRRPGYRLERVLMIDDSPEKLQRNYGNYLPVKPYYGDPEDTELKELIPFLDWIRHEPNFRSIEKRNWRDSQAANPGQGT